MDEKDNVYQFGKIKGGKDDNAVPENDYVVVDMDDDEYFAKGFLIFTPHHLAIMQDKGQGPVPTLCLPIGRVKFAELYEEQTDGGTLI